MVSTCLNAPSGAGCFLTQVETVAHGDYARLNAPCGAGCFLTCGRGGRSGDASRLNAPSGAGCFLTSFEFGDGACNLAVLMHLVVLGAF